jgi:hypothetical protein
MTSRPSVNEVRDSSSRFAKVETVLARAREGGHELAICLRRMT